MKDDKEKAANIIAANKDNEEDNWEVLEKKQATSGPVQTAPKAGGGDAKKEEQKVTSGDIF